MKFFNNENAVSEIVGAMLILLIIVLYLGIMQTYEVPKWNKELETQAFDLAYKDFLDLRSDIEESSIKNIPRTTSMHTGVRYPERFILRNPGQGAYGTFTTYPLKINISYNSNGTIYYKDYASLGIVYEMKGISDFPKLVYEHGIVIKEFGNWNYSDDENHIAKDNGIYIPLIKGIEPLSSTEAKTFNILPMTDFDIINKTSSINMTFETRYPGIWYNMLNQSIPFGSNITRNNTEIRIMNIFRPDIFVGFNRNLSLPNTSGISKNNIYSGTIRFADDNTIVNAIKINVIYNITNTNVFNVTNITRTNITNNLTYNLTNNFTNTFTTNITNNITNNISVYSVSSNCSTNGFYIWDISQGCMNLPTSASVQNFIIKDIRFGGSISNKDIYFSVQDTRGFQYQAQLHFNSNGNGDATAVTYQQFIPAAGCSPNPQLLNGEIDLTLCYRNSNIASPNVMKILQVEPGVLYAKFLIN